MKKFPPRFARTLSLLLVLPALQTLSAAPSLAATWAFELHAPTGTVTLGAPAELEGSVTIPADRRLAFAATGQDAGPFTILEAGLAGAEPATGGLTRQRVRLKVVPFDLGAVTLPALSWTLTDPSGAAEDLKSPPVRMEAVSPGPVPEEGQDIRDIKPPLEPSAWALLLPLALLAAAAWFGYREWEKRRQRGGPGQAAEAPDTRPPHVKALDELERLRQSELPVKEFYDRLSDILRAYLEARFGIAALVLTTSDLLRQLRQAELDRPVVARSKELFERADLAKFARLVPPLEEIRKDWDGAVQVVRDTAPKPPAEDLAGQAPPK